MNAAHGPPSVVDTPAGSIEAFFSSTSQAHHQEEELKVFPALLSSSDEALVATVAGLGVAIPALFGYNWLASQIKNVSADTQVFADEFLTRAAELHSR